MKCLLTILTASIIGVLIAQTINNLTESKPSLTACYDSDREFTGTDICNQLLTKKGF